MKEEGSAVVAAVLSLLVGNRQTPDRLQAQGTVN